MPSDSHRRFRSDQGTAKHRVRHFMIRHDRPRGWPAIRQPATSQSLSKRYNLDHSFATPADACWSVHAWPALATGAAATCKSSSGRLRLIAASSLFAAISIRRGGSRPTCSSGSKFPRRTTLAARRHASRNGRARARRALRPGASTTAKSGSIAPSCRDSTAPASRWSKRSLPRESLNSRPRGGGSSLPM